MTNKKSARDWAIFMNINNERYSDVERMTAIEHIAYAPTHNSITKAMMLDVIRYLLTAQQPRVLTEEDFIDNPLVDENGNVPAWCEHRVFNGVANDADGWTTINQWLVCAFSRKRFWSARPTSKQMEATPWE